MTDFRPTVAPLGWHSLIRPPYREQDEIGWLQANAVYTHHYGWQNYETWAIFNSVLHRGETRSGRALTIIDTEAGPFYAVGSASRAYTDHLAGARIYFTWWRGRHAFVIGEPPVIVTPPRPDTRAPGQTWSLLDYDDRRRASIQSAGRVVHISPDSWDSLPARIQFGCIR